jgi:hypothetical protein
MYIPDEVFPSLDDIARTYLGLVRKVGDDTNCSNIYSIIAFSRDAKGGYPLLW